MSNAKKENKKAGSYRFSEQLLEDMRKQADLENRSLTNMFETAAKYYLKHHQKNNENQH